MATPMHRDAFSANDDDARVERARLTVRIAIWLTALVALLAGAGFLASLADASTMKRSSTERYRFQRDNPCPANGAQRGKCLGYVIDHVVPLCELGADHRSNMQWLTIAEHREKNRAELERCRPKGERRGR